MKLIDFFENEKILAIVGLGQWEEGTLRQQNFKNFEIIICDINKDIINQYNFKSIIIGKS